MTNIATKNGAVIVKDGAIAERCECCSGGTCVEFTRVNAATAVVQLSASDFLQSAIHKYTPNSPFSGLSTYWEKSTLYFKGSELNGTHALTRRNDLSDTSKTVWDSDDSFWTGCPTGVGYIPRHVIRLTLYPPSNVSPNWTLSIPVVSFAWYSDRYTSSPEASGFRQASDFSCESLCSRCESLGRQNTLLATCDVITGQVSLSKDAIAPVAGYPVQFPVGFVPASYTDDYNRTTEYASGTLSTSFLVSSVSIG